MRRTTVRIPFTGGVVLTIHNAHYRSLIDELVAARKALGMNQEQLAKAWGRPQSIVARIEIYQRRIDVLELVALCEILILNPVELVARLTAATSGMAGGGN